MINHYPVYIVDWIMSGARARLNLEERGLYWEILHLLYHQEGVMSADTRELQRSCSVSTWEFKRSWPKVSAELEVLPDGRYTHPKVRATIEEMISKQRSKSEAGKKGARARWESEGCDRIANAKQLPMRIDGYPLLSSPYQKENRSVRKNPETALVENASQIFPSQTQNAEPKPPAPETAKEPEMPESLSARQIREAQESREPHKREIEFPPDSTEPMRLESISKRQLREAAAIRKPPAEAFQKTFQQTLARVKSVLPNLPPRVDPPRPGNIARLSDHNKAMTIVSNHWPEDSRPDRSKLEIAWIQRFDPMMVSELDTMVEDMLRVQANGNLLAFIQNWGKEQSYVESD